MSRWGGFFKSTLGLKYVMGLTGAALTGFVIVHMLGNLQIYLGPDAVNGYASKLKDMGVLLWLARGSLLAVFLLHIVVAVRLARLNDQARPQDYHVKGTIQASYAARTMLISGLVILAFTIYHLMHFTFGTVDPDYLHLLDGQGRHDVYGMMIRGFSATPVVIAYVAAQFFLCLHLRHGASSLFQSLGLNHPATNPLIRAIGPVLAVVIFIGNVSLPVSVLMGWVR